MTLKIARDGSVSDSADAGRDASRSPGEPSPGTSADASLAAESDVSPAELAAPAGAGAGQVPEDVQAPDAAPEPAPAPKVPPRTPPRRPPAVPRE